MPLYEYICSDCGNEFEKVVHFFNSNNEVICPRCESKETHRQLSLVASRNSGEETSRSNSCGNPSSLFR
jgi:putative FmdB family regulatory protein